MKITHVIPNYLPAQGGIEALIDGVVPELRTRHGVESTIIVPRYWRERPPSFLNADTEVLSIDMPKRYARDFPVSRAARLFKDTRVALRHSDPDIVHMHGIGHLFAPATNISKSLGLPIIHHVHGEVNENTRASHLKVLRTSPSVVTVSRPVAVSIERFAQRTAPITVMSNGLPDVTRSDDVQGGTRIAMVGRLEKEKGFAHGLMAAGALTEQFPDLQVSIVGLGEELLRLQGLAASLGIADKVTFHGRLTRAHTHDIVFGADVVVVPSLVIEGFSLVAAEAALLERPVVAYRVGGLSDTVADGQTGALVEAGDVESLTEHLRKYLADPQLRADHGRVARERARELFHVERYAHELADYYEQMLMNEGNRD